VRRAETDVIVIGAGLAGLTAARELAAAGYDVTVLEARDPDWARRNVRTRLGRLAIEARPAANLN
jgi:monoamine oxidase